VAACLLGQTRWHAVGSLDAAIAALAALPVSALSGKAASAALDGMVDSAIQCESASSILWLIKLHKQRPLRGLAQFLRPGKNGKLAPVLKLACETQDSSLLDYFIQEWYTGLDTWGKMLQVALKQCNITAVQAIVAHPALALHEVPLTHKQLETSFVGVTHNTNQGNSTYRELCVNLAALPHPSVPVALASAAGKVKHWKLPLLQRMQADAAWQRTWHRQGRRCMLLKRREVRGPSMRAAIPVPPATHSSAQAQQAADGGGAADSPAEQAKPKRRQRRGRRHK